MSITRAPNCPDEATYPPPKFPQDFDRTPAPWCFGLKDRGIIQLGNVIIRGQCLGGGFAVNSSHATPRFACLLIDLISDMLYRLEKLEDSSARSRKLSGANQDENQCENEDYLASTEIEDRQ